MYPVFACSVNELCVSSVPFSSQGTLPLCSNQRLLIIVSIPMTYWQLIHCSQNVGGRELVYSASVNKVDASLGSKEKFSAMFDWVMKCSRHSSVSI